MTKVLTFARVFPAYHPRAGQKTYFPEQILNSINNQRDYPLPIIPQEDMALFGQKHHTIREGHRWKEGEMYSPRVWTGKPYNSPQHIIAPDQKILKIYRVQMTIVKGQKVFEVYNRRTYLNPTVAELAHNDGLCELDFLDWFIKPFSGQTIVWSDKINY